MAKEKSRPVSRQLKATHQTQMPNRQEKIYKDTQNKILPKRNSCEPNPTQSKMSRNRNVSERSSKSRLQSTNSQKSIHNSSLNHYKQSDLVKQYEQKVSRIAQQAKDTAKDHYSKIPSSSMRNVKQINQKHIIYTSSKIAGASSHTQKKYQDSHK